jgi:hypothetical protein
MYRLANIALIIVFSAITVCCFHKSEKSNIVGTKPPGNVRVPPSFVQHENFYIEERHWNWDDADYFRYFRVIISNNGYNLDWVADHPDIENIWIMRAWNIDGFDFSPLNSLQKLRRLEIWCHDETFRQIPDLSGIQSLKRLELLNVSAYSLADIGNKMPNLESLLLDINGEKRTIDLTGLSAIKSLKKLTVWGGFAGGYALGCEILFDFSGMHNLESLDCSGNSTVVKGLDSLRSLKHLETDLYQPKQFGALNELTALEALSLLVDNDVSDFSFIERLENIEYIWLRNVNAQDIESVLPPEKKEPYHIEIDIAALRNKTKLKTLLLAGFAIDNIDVLNHLPALEKLSLINCYINPNNDYTLLNESLNVETFRSYFK